MARATERLSPHLWAFSLDNPQELSGNLKLQGPIVDTISNWVHADYLK